MPLLLFILDLIKLSIGFNAPEIIYEMKQWHKMLVVA